MIVRLPRAFEHELLSIIDYYQLLCNLVMFKYYMIVDDSFCRLNEQMIINDSFFGPQFCQKTDSNRNG